MKINADAQAALHAILPAESGVTATYRHTPKQVRHHVPVSHPHCLLKWYEIFPHNAPIPDEIRALARESIDAGELKVNGFGFVVLHRCGTNFYFLIASTWRNENELWQTVWYKDGDVMEAFTEFPREGTHKPVFCVWELATVEHEQKAWSTFLQSNRSMSAAEQWLSAQYTGAAT